MELGKETDVGSNLGVDKRKVNGEFQFFHHRSAELALRLQIMSENRES